MTTRATKRRVGLVSCMRNEAPFLLEWVAFHKTLGFDKIYVVSNDCTDGTDLMLTRLDEAGVLTHSVNPMTPDLGPQRSAMKDILSRSEVQALDWVLHIDADEFLNVTAGDHSIHALADIAGDADALALLWRPFGDSAKTRWSGESVLKTFIRTQPEPRVPNAHHKTMFRPDRFKRAIDHMPKDPISNDPILVNSRGQVCAPDALFHPRQSRFRLPIEQLTWDNACINHYAIRSHDIFLMKNVRGDGMGRSNTKYYLNSNFFKRQNKNGTKDTSILRHAPAMDALLAEYLSDPVLCFLHTHAVQGFFRQRDRELTPERIAEWSFPESA